MDKRAVAEILEDIGTLLELKGENVFKTRAYQNGARLILALDEDLATLVAEGRLKDLKGIGPALSEKIAELVTTGRLEYYETLKAGFPAGFMELLRIPGLGPKKARLLLEELKIHTVDDLEAAARAGQLAELPGFGAKSQEKILEGIAHIRKSADRFLVSVGVTEAERILAALAALPQIRKISVAGSLRRRSETIKDIDIVVATDDPAPIMAAFVELPGVESIVGHGPTKSSVRFESGVAADLRCVTATEFPFAMLYFTGSKAHNVAIRGRAARRGLRLNEYGLYPADGGDDAKSLKCRDEAAIYTQLGLSYVEPELREDTGEVAAAEAGTLPELIEEGDIRGLLHQHTNWSDGSNTLEEMARAAIDAGLEYFGITDHSQSAQYARGLQTERVMQQHAAIDALNEKLAGRIVLLKGIECDILTDGSLDYPDDILARFDYIVASVHSQFRLSESDQTKRMIRAVSNPWTRILGHPTGRLLLQRDPYAVNLHAVLEAAAAHGVAVEINASPYRLDLDWRECRGAKELGCRFTINPDAHAVEGLSDMRHGIGVARKGWLTKGDVINTLTLAELRRFFAREQVGAPPVGAPPVGAPRAGAPAKGRSAVKPAAGPARNRRTPR